MKYYLLLFLLVSCTSNYMPESFNEKMARYVPRSQQYNKVPQVQLEQDLLKKRGPASAKKKKRESNIALNNKSLYFVTLYEQYKSLLSFTSKDHKDIKVCPQFHSLVIQKPTLFNKEVQKKNWKLSSTKNELAHPVWNLPLHETELNPTVKEEVTEGSSLEKVSQTAVDIHASKIFKELSELCEYGSSDNYFIFENLIGQLSRDMDQLSAKDDMKVMLKTSLYFNMVLLKSLEKSTGARTIASEKADNTFYSEVIKRSGSKWAEDYLRSF